MNHIPIPILCKLREAWTDRDQRWDSNNHVTVTTRMSHLRRCRKCGVRVPELARRGSPFGHGWGAGDAMAMYTLTVCAIGAKGRHPVVHPARYQGGVSEYVTTELDQSL